MISLVWSAQRHDFVLAVSGGLSKDTNRRVTDADAAQLSVVSGERA